MVVNFSMQGEIALVEADNPPVNALGQAVRVGLLEAIDQAMKANARAVVICGKGRTWFAGADIREFGKGSLEPLLPDVINQIEALPVPVIGALHGTILGGGFEVALGCHYRICHPEASLGLPEVNLGLLPGAGGTQRLPRLIGYEPSIEIITSGKPISAQKALEAGVVDQLDEGEPAEIGLRYARALLEAGKGPRAVSEISAPEPIDFGAARAKVTAKGRGQLSLIAAVDAVEAAARLPFTDGLARERFLFREMMETDQRKGMIHAFFAERAAPKLPELRDISTRPLAQLGVIGGGTMGAGIATAALLSGLRVTLVEMSSEAAQAAHARVAGNLKGALKRGKIDEASYTRLTTEALVCVTDYASLTTADLILEAVFEDMNVKREVFAKIDEVAKPGAILASNTSYLDINEMAAGTSRPQDFIGLHFFSPAHVMRLLEVVVGDQTAPDVVATGFALAKRLGKIAVRAGVCDGFIGNRILSAYRTAADHMVLDGASPYQIDRALEAFGFAMGPFAVSDLAGLDIGWATRKRKAATRDPRERVPRYADKLCEAGHFGRKTGRGYYVYDGKEKSENPDVMPLIEAERAERGLTPRCFTDQEIVDNYMAAMVNEAAKVVGEGIARRPLDVDVTLLHGYGFPRYHGGPLKWADMRGLQSVLSTIQTLAAQDDFFWRPAPLLVELAGKSSTFETLNKDSS